MSQCETNGGSREKAITVPSVLNIIVPNVSSLIVCVQMYIYNYICNIIMYVTCFLHASLENDDPVLRHVGTTNHIFSMSKHTSLCHCACTRVFVACAFCNGPIRST